MEAPYKECASCIATPWCKRYKGEAPKPERPDWCNPKFRLDKALSLSNLPPKYINANAYNYNMDNENKEAYYKVKPSILSVVEEVNKGTNFFFYHNKPGTGKTFHGAMVMNQFIYKTCLTDKFDFEHPLAYFISYADIMDNLRYRRDDSETQRKLEIIKNVPLLLLDDLGSGTSSAFTKEQTYLIINHRFNNQLSTIFTSNFPLGQLGDLIDPRNVSRIVDNCLGVEVSGRDRRRDTIRGV